jgi:inhibitor of cysteine peptidase
MDKKPFKLFGLLIAYLLLNSLLTACASDNTLTLTTTDQGRSITLDTGQALAVRLPSNPTTGYRWEIDTLNQQLLEPVGEVEFVQDDRGGEEFVGVGGVEVFHFLALEPGRSELKLIYHRTWESEAPLEIFEVSITIR